MKTNYIVFLASIWYATLLMPYSIAFNETSHSIDQKTVHVNIDLNEQEYILKQTISVSLDSPHIQMGTINYQTAPHKKYIPNFADTKDVFENKLALEIPITAHNAAQSMDAHLHLSFLTLPDSTMNEQIYKLSFAHQTTPDSSELNYHSDTTPSTPSYNPTKKSFTESLQQMVQNNNNIWFRLLLALLLGLLLSLTPCIYPMIPITIGVLHNNQKGSSVARHFLGSLCYAFGLSTTFACLGLIAAFAGASFGSLLSNPIFVLILVAFIGYMSLTMIGIIDLTLPSFLQKSTQVNSAFGPFLSAYLFGLISGSVASPCVSPGLALLLTLVATMGNAFAGFLLLFCFGIGMSIPLIIIGTFSSSLSLLPQAGQWMVEVKKALGFVMLATCLYYLNNILPTFIFNWLVVGYFLFAALFYIIDAQKDFNPQQKTIKSLLGIILLAITVVMGIRAYDRMSSVRHEISENGIQWADSYNAAQITAQTENKLLLLDFWANHCTICKAIDKKLFKKDSVWLALKDKVVFVKVDCTTNSNEETNALKTEFKVFAQPTILIINPKTHEVLQKWSSEPYSMSPDEFIEHINTISSIQQR